MICPTCGQHNDAQAMYCQSCGSRVQESNIRIPSSITLYAGFWKRFAAVIIDALILAVAGSILTLVTFGGGSILIGFFGPWIYEAWMLSSSRQATLGKSVMSIMVTGIDGSRISFARATGRHFAKYVSALLLGVGFLMAAFTARKQALHDMIAETLVIEKDGNLP